MKLLQQPITERERLPKRKGRENRQRDPFRDQGESKRAGGSALEGKAGAVWEINASVKRGEVVMAGVRSISHTHPQTDWTDHASESSVGACVCENRRAQQIPPCVSKRSLQTQTLVYIQSRIFKSVPKNNRFDVWNVCLHFSTAV